MSDDDQQLLEFSFREVCTPVPPKTIKNWIYGTLWDADIDTTMWKSGGVVRFIISAVAAAAAVFSYQISQIARGGILRLASGSWKTIAALSGFGTRRLAATRAQALVALTNASTLTHACTAESVTIEGIGGKKYRNLAAFTLSPTSSATVAFAAVELGSGSNAAAGTVRTLVSTLIGVTVVNTTTFVGNDLESDSALEARALLKPRSRSPYGPKEAYERAALDATRLDGTSVGINRVGLIPDSFSGIVTATVAGTAGSVAGQYSDPSTDLGAVYAAMSRVTPAGVTLVLRSATNATFPIWVVIYWTEGDTPPSNAALTALLTPAFIAHFLALPLGGSAVSPSLKNRVFREAMVAMIAVTLAEAGYPTPKLISLPSPATDVVIAETAVPVLSTLTCQSEYWAT